MSGGYKRQRRKDTSYQNKAENWIVAPLKGILFLRLLEIGSYDHMCVTKYE